VIEGKATVNRKELLARDVARIENEDTLTIKAEQPTELMLIDLPERYAINN
jgi:redox-sensitive bicupin YhaK (pirin superfamily)